MSLSVADASQFVLQAVKPGRQENVSIRQSLSRTLAEDLLAPNDSPPFDKALMDGFAVYVPNTTSVPTTETTHRTFQVVETITAGLVPRHEISGDLCARIMTGAPLPNGCNSVVPIEQTQFDEANPQTVTIPLSVLRPDANLMRRGTAARAGSRLLRAGTRLQPQQIAALAEFGFGSVAVSAKPRVAVLATGDELIGVDEPLLPGKIRNSNEPMLLAQIEASLAIPVSLGVARDTEADLEAKIGQGLQCDVLLLTGGVSAGILDLVPQQLSKAGVSCVFHGVQMKPGKPLWFGYLDRNDHRCLVFGLPGNPVSSLVCFELFVRLALQNFLGIDNHDTSFKASLTEAISVKGNRPVYQPVTVSLEGGTVIVKPVPWSGSSDLRATVEANGMALLRPENGVYSAGDLVDVWLWGDQRIG